jgi:hypothetical protein
MTRRSLLAGRNQSTLTVDDQRRVSNTFLGMEPNVNVVFDAQANTAFRIVRDSKSGEEYGEVVVGSDIYPGGSVIDPNSALSMDAAAAHELQHFHRWRNKALLEDDALFFIDEALTSLEAIFRYETRLSAHDIRLLLADAVQRINLYLAERAAHPDGTT